jgi:hypothetical protein
MEIFQPFGVGQYQSSIGRVIGGLAVAETAAPRYRRPPFAQGAVDAFAPAHVAAQGWPIA